MSWVLFAHTNYDITTRVLSQQVMPKLIEYAKSRLYNIYDLSGSNATRNNFTYAVLSKNPEAVIISGHGESDGIAGQESGVDILSLTNAILMGNRIGYFIACKTGLELAPQCVDSGARVILAWDDVLTIVVDDNEKLLEGFVECLTAPKILFDGYSMNYVYSKTIETYNDWIKYWDEKDPLIADILRHDRDHYRMFGSGASYIKFGWGFFVSTVIYMTYLCYVLGGVNVIIDVYKALRRG
jgi:hypothetical protein